MQGFLKINNLNHMNNYIPSKGLWLIYSRIQSSDFKLLALMKRFASASDICEELIRKIRAAALRISSGVRRCFFTDN